MSSVTADPTERLHRRRIPLALGSRLGGAKLLRGGLLLLAALLVLSVVGSLASPDHNHQDLSTAL